MIAERYVLVVVLARRELLVWSEVLSGLKVLRGLEMCRELDELRLEGLTWRAKQPSWSGVR